MLEQLLNALFVLIFVAALGVWVVAAISMWGAIHGRRDDRAWGDWVFGGLVLFLPRFFTDEGNRHRSRFLRSSLVFLVLCAAGAGVIIAREYVTCGAFSCP
jgi:hypothetical protein